MRAPEQAAGLMNRPHTLAVLDGFRGVAALMVAIFHADGFSLMPYMPIKPIIGHGGVLLFFVLSGFLMAYHYLPGIMHLRYWLSFLIRRFFRIYPVYALVVLFCYMGYLYDPKLLRELEYFDLDTLWRHLGLIRGWFIFWTVSLELRFYLVLPLIAVALFYMPPRWHIGGLLLVATLLNLYGPVGQISRYMVDLSAFVGIFIMGVAAGHYHRNTPVAEPGRWAVAGILALALLAGLFYLLPSWEPKQAYAIWNKDWLLSPVVAVLLLCLARGRGGVEHLLSLRVMRFFGRISFSLYLVHAPLFAALTIFLKSMHYWHKFIIIWPLVVAISWLLYRLVELPAIAYGKQLATRVADRD